jgi:hypothetical protein
MPPRIARNPSLPCARIEPHQVGLIRDVNLVLRFVENRYDQPPDKNAYQHIRQSLFHGRLPPNPATGGATAEGKRCSVQQSGNFFQAPNVVGDLCFHCRSTAQAGGVESLRIGDGISDDRMGKLIGVRRSRLVLWCHADRMPHTALSIKLVFKVAHYPFQACFVERVG